MAKFIMIRYNNKKYPENIPCEINEVAGHFDKERIIQTKRYSLHTEYSFEKRNFDSKLLDGLNEIKASNRNGIPQLWKNEKWAEEFFSFIEQLLGDSIPEIIEIHPPFIDYCNSIDAFLNIYESFETKILDKYKHTKIFIENRCGTHYGNRFTISNISDVIMLCKKLFERKLQLKIVLDYPQLMSAEGINPENDSLDKLIEINNEIKEYVEYLGGIHLWGKKRTNKRLIPHHGNLNTLFNNNISRKNIFLKSILNAFTDKDMALQELWWEEDCA